MIFKIENLLKRKYIVAAALALMAGLVYCNTFAAPFTLDDFGSIVNNYSIRSPLNIAEIWKFYSNRFVLYYTLALNYAVHDSAVAGYHIVNLAIHILNGILFYLILLEILGLNIFKYRLTGRYKNIIASLGSMLFVVHPIQINAVTYIIQRTASLAATFYFLSILFFLKFRLGKKLRYYVLMFVSILLAMFTKENTITIPFMLLLIESMFFAGDKSTGWKKRILMFIPVFLTLPIIPGTNLLLKGYSQSDPDVTFKASTSMDRMQYFYTELNVIVLYLRILFLPYGQCFDYSNDFPYSATIWQNHSYLSFDLLFIIGLIGIFAFRKNKLLSLGILWFFIGLSVESSFISIKDVYFEHRLYFPTGGFIMALIGLAFSPSPVDRRLYLFKKPLLGFVSVFSAVIIIFSGLTLYRNYIYSDPIRLWYDTVKKAPRNDRAHSVLASSYMDKYEADTKNNAGYYDMSEKEFKLALELNSSNGTALCNLSKLYLIKGDLDKSIETANEANRVSRSEYAYYNIGAAYEKKGDMKRAIEAYLEAYRMDEKKAFVLKALGLAYYNIGDFPNARIYLQKYVDNYNYNDNKEMREKIEDIDKKLGSTGQGQG